MGLPDLQHSGATTTCPAPPLSPPGPPPPSPAPHFRFSPFFSPCLCPPQVRSTRDHVDRRRQCHAHTRRNRGHSVGRQLRAGDATEHRQRLLRYVCVTLGFRVMCACCVCFSLLSITSLPTPLPHPVPPLPTPAHPHLTTPHAPGTNATASGTWSGSPPINMPTTCNVTVDHTEMSCVSSPGLGSFLKW
jgi:hypothetical protein